ncbi:glycoside hydrolase family 2 TIM barrel-domain containing protein [Arthrobacter sp. efr-133-TYG-118]|uniref:glycoside hydrolase family 2 TIM barrel-domain containing protein n=1 Tax=Arthrobacter sp. efr-133-TYG-118 TaxID=3040279 RepID=UPI002550A603|nr:glycoside hydrolase family 2 TIM barrel-domain containing protein [Arthrobacter sp. efr-133-TYG-118]
MTEISFNDGWSVRPKSSIFAELGGPAPAAEAVRLPHDALIKAERAATGTSGAPGGYFPSAAVEYSKTFDVPEEYRSKRLAVLFQGVYRDAMVYVNGIFAAQRPNGYSTFVVPLDPYLQYGSANTIRVEARAHNDSRWYTGVGIHRDTKLFVTDLVHVAVDGVRVTTPDIDARRAVVEVATTVQNDGIDTRHVSVTTNVHDAEGAVVASDIAPVTLRAGTSAVAHQRLYVRQPKLWNVDSPSLYTATSMITGTDEILDERETTFGIRTLQLDPEDGLRINGVTTKLRGACIHHDNGIIGAATIGRAEERRVQILKEAGFNAIRSAHNPISQAMLNACDRHGMLVMDETFDMWAESKSPFDYSLAFPEWWERDVEAMVAKDINHPSVIFYAIGNEIPETGTPLGSGWGRKLAEKIRSLDNTRFVTNGINGFVSVMPDVVTMMKQQDEGAEPGGVNTAMSQPGDFMNMISASPLVTEKTAESFSVLDVAGMNYGDGRYVLDRELFPNRIIVGTETFPGRINVNWRLVEENTHVIGDFTWTGWDYLGEAGIGRMQYLDGNEQPQFGAPYPWLLAWCGDIDITGYRRPASYYRETVFGLRHEPYIAVQRPEFHDRNRQPGQWTWSDSIASWSWAVPEGSPVTVEVYSDADEVELLLNGRSVGRAPTGRENAYRAEFELRYEPGELAAVGYVGSREHARTILRSASDEFQLDVRADRIELNDDDSDLAFVAIELRDDEGVLATHVERKVSVEVTGSGVLQALGSARPDPVDPYDGNWHSTFDGRLLAVVRPTGPGPITIRTTAEDADTVTTTLYVLAQNVGRPQPGQADG